MGKKTGNILSDKPEGGNINAFPSATSAFTPTLMDDTTALMDDTTATMSDNETNQDRPSGGKIKEIVYP